jgi:hypothetical protein
VTRLPPFSQASGLALRHRVPGRMSFSVGNVCASPHVCSEEEEDAVGIRFILCAV